MELQKNMLYGNYQKVTQQIQKAQLSNKWENIRDLIVIKDMINKEISDMIDDFCLQHLNGFVLIESDGMGGESCLSVKPVSELYSRSYLSGYMWVENGYLIVRYPELRTDEISCIKLQSLEGENFLSNPFGKNGSYSLTATHFLEFYGLDDIEALKEKIREFMEDDFVAVRIDGAVSDFLQLE